MTSKEDKRRQLIEAKKQVRRIKIFYMHLALYIIAIGLILYNFYILEEGPYKNNIISLNLSVIVAWTVFISIHGLNVFMGRRIFKRSWENKKVEEFFNKDKSTKTTTWE
ncbi:2TM domain-containing protein [Winogradskyella flava]|uniref:2TM domain-containing protein n=1 Tax=Winogradskyella flava TaxID=1884876 RepID=A0A842IR83_9FLAO|nr:2TM domain-containing protein [Winogradskyella flava]MBC2845712.1 2TM domain-containing protein [Winogradskyella flava]